MSLKELIYSLVCPDRCISGVHARPSLDGPFAANRRLEEAPLLPCEVSAPDDFLLGPDAKLYLSSGNEILVFGGLECAQGSLFARLEAEVGGLGWSRDGRLLVCVSGRGVCALREDGTVSKWLESAGGAELACPTALTTAADGTVYVTDGSRHNPTENWLQDLMANQEGSGRLISWDADLNEARVIAEGLSWPAGVALSHDEREVLVTEAWSHKLCAVKRQGGGRRYLVDNYAGYPWRITRGKNNDYWLAFLALRSQLIDFVLRERDYCDRMMAEVPPEFWIGLALSSEANALHPTQYGRVTTLGVQKPWAPARSYGLVARLDVNGQALESFHSRVGGKVHGVTSVRCAGAKVIACSKGDGKLVDLVEPPKQDGNC